ncbi:N-acetyltransferase [Vulcanococcus sp.]|uniref:N-acetyltransferase n=1 Tax=Vulcanococcus sp. TaxID=2856995 RepID=UPI00322CDF44
MLDSLLIPFRAQPQAPVLPQGYSLDAALHPAAAELNGLLTSCGDPARPLERIEQALERSAWSVSLRDGQGQLVGFVRATSDLALNANLWDLVVLPADPAQNQLYLVLVHAAMTRLRRELPGCSISVAAPALALEALKQSGFVVDPGGIRAMGLPL